MSNVLVVGGAGYIGSHMVKMLGRQGCSVTTLDDLSFGHRDAVLCGDFVQCDMGDRAVLDAVLSGGFDAMMHFASFIHIEDLCSAHWLALQSLMGGAGSQAYNLGNGQGFSVQEVIDTAQQVTGRSIAVVNSPRRAGDPARLVADSSLIREKLGWQPRYADLATIVAHAWAWETRQT